MSYNPRPISQVLQGNVSEEMRLLASYLDEELALIAQSQTETIALDLRLTYREPDRPREGMIVAADGTSWNPGSGGGPYVYFGAAWVPLSSSGGSGLTHPEVMSRVSLRF